MEWFGYALIFGLIFIVLIGVFSDRSDRRGGYRRRRSVFWDDDDYDYPPPYWPPPYPYGYRRRQSFGSLLIAFFLGILLYAVVAGKIEPPEVDPPIVETHLDGSKRHVDSDEVPEVKLVASAPKPPKRKLERQPNDRMMKLAPTDPVSLRQIQQTYPGRGIEGYRDDSTGQIWAVVFGTSESLDDIGFIMTQRADDLKERCLAFTQTVYRTGQVCPNGNIVREEGTNIWFCDK